MSSKLDELGYVIGVLFDHLVRRISYFVLNNSTSEYYFPKYFTIQIVNFIKLNQ